MTFTTYQKWMIVLLTVIVAFNLATLYILAGHGTVHWTMAAMNLLVSFGLFIVAIGNLIAGIKKEKTTKGPIF